MKAITKWVAVGMTAVLAGSLAACSNAGNGDAKPSGSNTAEKPVEKSQPTPIKVFISDHSQPVPSGKSMDMPQIKYMAEKTNTNLDITFLPHKDYQQNLQVKFAAGEVPDVFQYFALNDLQFVAQGQAMELDTLIDKHGPNLKKAIPQAAWDAVRINGKIVAVPAPQTYITERLIYMRKDWLDKVGMSVPKTSDELLNVLRAFRDKDPNGNGKQDEIPFSMREKITWVENIFGMWGVNPDTNVLYNGQVIPGFIHPNTKKGLEFLATMHKEKLLDQESFTNTRQIWEQKIQGNAVGSWNHVTGDGWTWQKRLNDALKNNNSSVVTIPTPKGSGYDGPIGRTQSPIKNTWVISKNAKNAEAIIKWLDWLATDEGSLYSTLGVEGETYKKEGDKLIFDLNKNKELKYEWRGVFTIGPMPEAAVLARQDHQKEAYDKAKAAGDISVKEGLPNPTASMPVMNAAKTNPDLKSDGTLWQEAAAKIILGKEPADYWEKFVESWKKQGGEQLIKEQTDWYNKNVKK